MTFRPSPHDKIAPTIGTILAINLHVPALRLLEKHGGGPHRVFPAIHAGAQRHLLKDIAPNDLVQDARTAYLGQVELHPILPRN